MPFTATDYYILLKTGEVQRIAGVTNKELLPADPTLANTNPLTQAYLIADGPYRDNRWLGGTSHFQSADDGVDPTVDEKDRLPDDVMHIPPRNLVALYTHWHFTCGEDGPTFDIPWRNVRSMGTHAPTF